MGQTPDRFVTIDRVSRRFDTDAGVVEALQEVDLTIRRGEFVSVVGPSGCGKSTLLRIIAGLIPPSEGKVSIDGEGVAGPKPEVAVVFQKPVLLPWRTVRDNVLLPAQIRGAHKQQDIEERVDSLLAVTGLSDFARSLPGELSGGMQQRAAICRALSLQPGILLMDEPFGALDAITRDEMGFELLRIWEATGATVLFITHSIPEALFLSDRVIVMSARPGRVVDDVRVDLPRPRTAQTFSAPKFVEMSAMLRDRIASGYQKGSVAV